MAFKPSFKRSKKPKDKGEPPLEVGSTPPPSSQAPAESPAASVPSEEARAPKLSATEKMKASLSAAKKMKARFSGLSLGKKPLDDDAAGAKPLKVKAASKKGKLKAVGKRSCFVLIIGDEGGILVLIDKGQVMRRVYAPSAEQQHIKLMMEMLNSNPKIPLYVLCDLIDQSYVRHTLPPVSSLSIQKLVARRLKRDFAPEDITGSLSLGREKSGRKEWNFLLIALANSSTLQQWLDPMLQVINPCKGVHLVPVEAQGFISSLSQALAVGEGMESSEWKILLLHDKVSGFRQIVFHEEKLVFTRLTPLPPESSPEIMAGNVEQEVQNTIEYLRRMSFNDDAGLDVYIILAQEVRDLIEAHKLSATQVRTLSPFDVSKLLGLNQAALSGDRFADVVLCANFGMRQKPSLKMMTAYAKKLDQLYMANLGVRGVAVLLVLGLVYSTVIAGWGWQKASGVMDDIESKLTVAQSDLATTQKEYERLDDNQEAIMRISALYKTVKPSPADPLDFVREFARLKNDSVRVLGWSWGRAGAPMPDNPDDQDYRISARIEILDHIGDTRILAQKVNELTEGMKRVFPSYSISRSQLPSERKVQERERNDLVLDLNAPIEQETYEVQSGDDIMTYTLMTARADTKQAEK